MAARPRLCHCSAAAPVLKTATSQPVGSLAAVWRIAVLKLDLLLCSAITCAFRRVRSSSTRICDVEVSCALQSSNQISGEVYSMTKTMTPDPGKYDPGKLNDDPDSMTSLNYDVLSLDLAK